VPLPAAVGNAVGWHKAVMEAELSFQLQKVIDRASAKPGAAISAMMERGASISATSYLEAQQRMQTAAGGFNEYFDHFDAIITPATLGPAPTGLQSTGDPVMSTVWTFAGLPCISLPLLQTEDGLPIGVQLVGGLNNDARLLRTARWLTQRLGAK
jgi:Asp-tRNA(Asn)/Glu-tRNA(Gln) amidotransferase A subunit family amidase